MEIAILPSDKVDFKTVDTKKTKRALYNEKGSIQEEDIMFVNLYAP